MWMTEYQFIYQTVTNVCYIKLRFLFTYPGIEGNMQQHVTQLLTDILHVVLHQCVAELVGFFYRVGAQTLVGLLAVPWTFLAQCIQHVEHTSKGLHFLLTGMSLFHSFCKGTVFLYFYSRYSKKKDRKICSLLFFHYLCSN